MAMSRTARILIAILLLAAAAFFWVNFYTQSRSTETPTPTDGPVVVADDPESTPLPADGAAVVDADGPDAAQAPGETTPLVDVDGDAATDADAPTPDADAPAGDGESVADTEGPVDGVDAAEADVVTPTVVAPADDAPPTIVVDVPVAVGREIVIADLPFLVTQPRPEELATEEAVDVETSFERAGTAPTRVTVNPFSPVVVRTPPAPERDVPDTAPVVGEVAVPAGPTPAEVAAAEVAARASAPTPRPITPGSPGDTSALRPLPTGSVLSSTPALLREPRVGSAAEEVDFATVSAIAVPAAEPADLAPNDAPPAQADAPDEVAPLTGTTDEADATIITATTPPPLAAGATQLARFLRDQNYAFTGSVLGPVGVGVFRSDLDPAPVVVALGQNLPDTEIVLTDLRGQQAELRLGDSTQILTLDLRR